MEPTIVPKSAPLNPNWLRPQGLSPSPFDTQGCPHGTQRMEEQSFWSSASDTYTTLRDGPVSVDYKRTSENGPADPNPQSELDLSPTEYLETYGIRQIPTYETPTTPTSTPSLSLQSVSSQPSTSATPTTPPNMGPDTPGSELEVFGSIFGDDALGCFWGLTSQDNHAESPISLSLNGSYPSGGKKVRMQLMSSERAICAVELAGQRSSVLLAPKLPCRRFSAEQSNILDTWLHSHLSDPYPHREEKQRLAKCTGLSVRQVESWLSRARSRNLTRVDPLVRRKHLRKSPLEKCLPTEPSVGEESPSQSLSQRSSLTIEAGGDPAISESSASTLEPNVSERPSAGTHITPPTVNRERIPSSLSALVNALVLFLRLVRMRRSKLDEAASSPVNATRLRAFSVPAAALRTSLGDTVETQSNRRTDWEFCFGQWQDPFLSSPETDSVNSFEGDTPEDSSGDEERNIKMHCWPTSEGLSCENMLSMLRPLLATLPDEFSLALTSDLTLLFYSWAVDGSLERPSHPPSASSSTLPRSQANGSAGSSTETSSSSGSGKKRPLRDDSESPGDGDDDKNGDDTRKRLRLSSQSQEDIAHRWACPFYQRSPHYYCIETEYGDYRKCAKSPGFSGVHRVKDHIYKCHASIYCDRCYFAFKNEVELTAHRRDPSPCDVQDPRPMQGLTNEQKKLLKPRDRNKSEKARWNSIYKICFPDDEFIPSPYYIYYSRETAELRRDVFTIVVEETRSLDDTVRDRICERLQHAFNNVQMRSSLGITGLPTPSSSEISSQQSWEAGPSPRSPLASRSGAVSSMSHQAIPAEIAEPGGVAPIQDQPLADLNGLVDDTLFFESIIGSPVTGESGDGVSGMFGGT